MKSAYVPDRGDIVWLDSDPQAGHEQAGHRLALVLWPARYNEPRSMVVSCPTTSRIRGYRLEVIDTHDPPSVAPMDQVKSLEWRAPGGEEGQRRPSTVVEVQAKMGALLGF